MAATANNQRTTAVYADFSQPTDSAKFELVIEGRSLFVNAHTLAESSPFFAKLCFGDGFKEKEDEHKAASIDEEKYEDVQELFRCLLPNYSKGVILKPITATNFVTIVRLSAKFHIGALATTAEHFIAQFTMAPPGGDAQVLAMLDAAVLYHLNAKTITKLIGRATAIAEAQLTAISVDQWPSQVVKALMVARLEHLKKRPTPGSSQYLYVNDHGIVTPFAQSSPGFKAAVPPSKRGRKGN